MGMLFSQGYTLDNILDMPLSQIMIVTECSMIYKGEVVDYILSIISSALGGKVSKKGKKSKNKIKKPNNVSLANDGIDAVMGKFSSLGIATDTISDK
jgi:hypothetical protein